MSYISTFSLYHHVIATCCQTVWKSNNRCIGSKRLNHLWGPSQVGSKVTRPTTQANFLCLLKNNFRNCFVYAEVDPQIVDVVFFVDIVDIVDIVTIRKLPWSIHSEEVPSGLVETSATLCWFFAIGWVVTDRLSNWIFSYKVNFLDLKVTVYVL